MEDVFMEDAEEMSFETAIDEQEPKDALVLDCYPYSFTPLLLFTSDNYFDKGYSNYHSVAAFFQTVLPVNMMDRVLCDRKNMLYEELLAYILDHEMLVTCCVDAHFTAFSVVQGGKKPALLYYDPCQASCKLVTGESAKLLALFLLLKCNYGDSQHIQDNKDYYTGNPTRRSIYTLWKKINTMDNIGGLYQLRLQPVGLNLDRYLLINSSKNPRQMSTQLTSNTCYFQTFLYVQQHGHGMLLCLYNAHDCLLF